MDNESPLRTLPWRVDADRNDAGNNVLLPLIVDCTHLLRWAYDDGESLR